MAAVVAQARGRAPPSCPFARALGRSGSVSRRATAHADVPAIPRARPRRKAWHELSKLVLQELGDWATCGGGTNRALARGNVEGLISSHSRTGTCCCKTGPDVRTAAVGQQRSLRGRPRRSQPRARNHSAAMAPTTPPDDPGAAYRLPGSAPGAEGASIGDALVSNGACAPRATAPRRDLARRSPRATRAAPRPRQRAA
jgi:hypothetical protein